jgi:hypothetical protein
MITQPEVRPLAVRWDPLAVGSAMTLVAAAYLVLLAGVVAFVGASSPPAQVDPDFAADPHRFMLYRLGFVCASLLAPLILTLLSLLVLTRGGIGARDMVGMLILVTYPPLSSLAYASQWTLLPRLIDSHPGAAASWYFHDSHSIPYTMDLLGYALFGTAAVLLSLGFLRRSGPWRWVGVLLLGSGATSVLAFAFLGAGWETVHFVSTLTSAALTVPLAFVAMVIGRTLRR